MQIKMATRTLPLPFPRVRIANLSYTLNLIIFYCVFSVSTLHSPHAVHYAMPANEPIIPFACCCLHKLSVFFFLSVPRCHVCPNID